MNDRIALIGNPNCGKTTLFNALTGTYRKTGNWSGVTTEKKDGAYRKDKRITVTDLPGLYSLGAASADERAVLNYLRETPPKAIINVVDGTHLQKCLFLTFQIAELGIPAVLAVNMKDDLEKNGMKLKEKELERAFGMPVVAISALKNTDLDLLMETASSVSKPPAVPNVKGEAGESLAAKRFSFIERASSAALEKRETRAERFTHKADRILTHKYLGIPIFFAVITAVYAASMSLGGLLGDLIDGFFLNFSRKLSLALSGVGVADWLISLLCEAVFKGMGSIFSLLPQILILFLLLALIEESGYAARVAFILDRFFRAFGLGGRSLLPMIVSCGCTVPGIMATRTIEDAGEKRMTIFLSPFMPCGAKTAVFGWLSAVVFGRNPLIAASAYFLGILAAAVFGRILKRFKPFFSGGGSFVMEMPTLRLPSAKDVWNVLWEKFKDFTVKAGMIIFLVSIGLWTLKNLGLTGYVGDDAEKSFLYAIGNALKIFFVPLGFGNWQATVSLITGIFAREAVAETLSLVAADPAALFYNEFSAYAFMAFVLLSPPCAASIAAARRELGSVKMTFAMIIFHLAAAYLTAFAINLSGIILNGSVGLILSAGIVIILSITAAACASSLKKKRCAGCGACRGGKKCTNTKRNTTL